MPRTKRKLVAPDGVSVTLHCYSRCVRRAYLCGIDQETTQNFDYRKAWIQSRLEFLASIFAIDILGFAVMDNHFHLICRTRPDISQSWDDQEVAKRWYRLFPKRRTTDGQPASPSKVELDEVLSQPATQKHTNRADQLRTNLQCISWLMKSICEYIAKRANREDDVTGSFWEGRFKAQKLLNEQAILASAAYVDLNPIRAARANSPEQSKFTSIYERIQANKKRNKSSNYRKRLSSRRADFLSPVQLSQRTSNASMADDLKMISRKPSRVSDKGFLRMSFEKYLLLLEWTGRQLHSEKRGRIPPNLAPIFERLELNSDTWLDCVQNFARWFGWAVGSDRQLDEEKKRCGRQRMRGRPQAASAFG